MKNIKMKKVLIALDYDPTAQKVAESGYALAKTMGAEVVLLHVISDPVYYSTTEYSPVMGFTGYMDISPLQLDSVENLIKASQHYLYKSKEHLGDDSIQIIVKEGDYAEAIISAATESHADIIVVGSHGRKWLEKIVMGSVTEKVLQLSSIPLFVVPTRKNN